MWIYPKACVKNAHNISKMKFYILTLVILFIKKFLVTNLNLTEKNAVFSCFYTFSYIFVCVAGGGGG